jgi:ferredoxin-NADP reductase
MEKFSWQFAQVIDVVQETPAVKTFTLLLSHWIKHLPGQHYDIRLTAEDGYQAQRSYSIASSPAQGPEIQLTVELVNEGEISHYMHEVVAVGDFLEIRGPIGGHFVWSSNMVNDPLLLVAGGSGIVPLMAMLRHRAAIGAINRTALLFSIRSAKDVIYRRELELLSQQSHPPVILFTYTRNPPAGWSGFKRRIDREMLFDELTGFEASPQCFVCGPSALVEQVAITLVDLGVPADKIRTERFGPS